MDELAFVTELPAQGRKTFRITLSSEKSTKTYPERVYADMFITDHRKGKHQRVQAITVPGTSNIYSMVRPHGPVLESELVGYRLYFNEKQTPDIYGKFNKGLEIKESQFYPTDEQLTKGFGDDVLRVFDSCGPGALKGWDGQKAIHVTPVETRTGTYHLLWTGTCHCRNRSDRLAISRFGTGYDDTVYPLCRTPRSPYRGFL